MFVKILFLLFPFVLGDIYSLSPQPLVLNDPLLIRRVAMYAPKDAPNDSPPGKGKSFIKSRITFKATDGKPKIGVVEVVIVSGNTLDIIQGCNSQEMILDIAPHTQDIWKATISFENVESAVLDGTAGEYDVKTTGNHWLIISNCDPKLDNIEFSGETEWMNPYGYLPGRVYPYLPFYGYMSLLYLIVGVLWFILNAYYWKDVVMLQNFITFVLALCMLEMATWFFDYRNFNITGVRHVGVVVCGMLISVFRRSVSRMLVVAVSLGYGVVRPTLGDDGWKLATIGCVYFVAESALELVVRYGQTNEVGSMWRIILSLPPAALNAVFYWWIFLALARLTEQLALRRQDEKLALYKQFTRVLGFSLFVAVIFALYQMYYMSSGYELTHWENLWLLEGGFPEMLYTLILFTILVLWRPSTNNKRFAYAQLAPNEATAVDEEDEFGALPTEQVPGTGGPASPSANGTEMKPLSKPRFTIGDGEGEEDDDEEKNKTKDEPTIPHPNTELHPKQPVLSSVIHGVEENIQPVVAKID